MSGIKITPADVWFSHCVRERAEWNCERCGTHYTPPTQALHCSHYEGRGNWATRFDPLNAISLCYGCHRLVGSRRLHDDLYVKIFGESAQDIINEKRNNITLYKEMKRTKGRGEIAKHYKSEYERMMGIRAEGVTGRIDFIGYE